jgi:hypothetical protein
MSRRAGLKFLAALAGAMVACVPAHAADEILRSLLNDTSDAAPIPADVHVDGAVIPEFRDMPPAATARLQAAPLSDGDFLTNIFGSLFGNSLTGSAESACFGSKLKDIDEYKGTPSFPRLEVAALQRATVRITFQTSEAIETIAKTAFKRKRYTLGDLPYNAETAFCTGTMIAHNLVLTAGHCVHSDYFEKEAEGKPRMPRVYGRAESKLSDDELGRFTRVQFNEQAGYSVADADAAAVAGPMDKFSADVIEVVSSDYKPPYLDYAILKLDPDDLPEHVYAIGWSNMVVDNIPRRSTPLAIIQHPNGGKKRIATGTVLSNKGNRIFYADLSTEPGSSGAGILSRGGMLVGIHTRGYCSDSASSPKNTANANQGVRLSSIKPILKSLLRPAD